MVAPEAPVVTLRLIVSPAQSRWQSGYAGREVFQPRSTRSRPKQRVISGYMDI